MTIVTCALAGVVGFAPTVRAESIGGIVTVPAGFAAGGICVNAYPNRGGLASSGFTNPDGTYVMTVAVAGTYTVAVNIGCPGNVTSVVGLPSASQQNVVVPAGGEVTGINFALLQPGSAKGRIRVPAGYSPAGICVFVNQDTKGIGVPGRTDANGVYTIPDLPPGTYTLHAVADERSCSGQRALRYQDIDGVVIRDGQLTDGVDFTLREVTADDIDEWNGVVKPLRVATTVVTETAITQQVVVPANGSVDQIGVMASGARAGKAVTVCTGKMRVRAARSVVTRCRITAAGRAARKRAPVRVRLTTVVSSPSGVFRAVRTITLPKVA